VGTKIGSLVRNKAVPFTTWGGLRFRLRIRSLSGISPRLVFKVGIAVPPRPDQDRHHDGEGQRDPCPLEQVRKLALKNAMSTITKGMTIAAAAATRKFHSFKITTKPMTPSTSMVVETAMP
jgi:hypothetical protein